jgi:hypothetical protein
MPLQPLLLIGVGGSGAKALRTLRQTMLRRLRMQGWTGSTLPEAWQMLAIDTVTNQSRDGYSAPLLPGTDYLGLVPRAATYDQIVRPLIEGVPKDQQQSAFLGWLVEKIPGSVEHGAGQNRGVGRSVAAARLGALRIGIEQKLSKVQSAQATLSLESVAPLLGASSVSTTPMAWVISSIAGGTGAGMFLDVIEALKASDPQVGVQAQVVLFSPEIFQPLIDKGLGPGIGANALASLCEITSGVWGKQPSSGTVQLYEKGGMPAVAAGRGVASPAIGSRYNYIVGATNADGVPIGHLDHAYVAVGDSLSSLVLDENVLDRFNNFFRVNVFDNTWQAGVVGDESELKGLTDPQFTQPFASFGSSRVSLGTDRFLEYASVAFTRDVVERLLWPRFTPDDPRLARPDHVRIKAQVELSREEFIDRSGLNERGEDQNDVLSVLSGPEGRSIGAAFASKIVRLAADGVDQGGLAPSVWLQRLMLGVEARESKLRADMIEAVEAAARRFLSKLEGGLTRLVSEFAAREGHGIAVAHDLVSWLRSETAFVASSEMPAEQARYESLLTDIRGDLSQVLEGGLKTLPTGHAALKEAEARLVDRFARNVYESVLRQVAREVLNSVESELLAPIERALSLARVTLLAGAERDMMDDGTPNPYTKFPRVGERPGPEFRPGPTEMLLIPADEFPGHLEEQLRLTYGRELEGQWKQRTIERLVLDLALTEEDDSQAVGLLPGTTTWVPAPPRLRWSGGSPSSPAYDPLREVDDLRERAEQLFSDSSTAIGKFAGESLQGFLEHPDPATVNERQTAFLNSLVTAFNSSAPLASINKGLTPILHPLADGTIQASLAVSKIPLDPGTPHYTALEGKLTAIGMWDPMESPRWFGKTSAPQVDIFQVTGRAMSAMAFDTIMRPIHAQWTAMRGHPGQARSFWTWRRARPLIESLPISHEQVERMALGWTVAGILGLRENWTTGSNAKDHVTHVKVWDSSEDRWSEFPAPMLDRQASGFSLFPAVLASCSLAMLEANAASSLAPLTPYHALIALADTAPQGPLGRWILEGRTVTTGAPQPNADKAGTRADTPEHRRAEVVERLIRDQESLFADHCQRTTDMGDPFLEDQAWELRDLIDSAYHSAIRAAQTVEDLDV